MTEANNISSRENKELLIDIWTKPKEVFQYLLKTDPRKNILLLFYLAGIVNYLDRAVQKDAGDSQSLTSILLLSLLGGIAGIIGYYLYSYALSVTGNWLGGKAGSERHRTILACSMIPQIATLILLVPELIIFGSDWFSSSTDQTNVALMIVFFIFGGIHLVLSIWSFVLLVIGVKLIQNFSTLRAIGNLLLPVMVIVGIVLIIFLFTQII
ncbi:Yip1 family protein [Gramella sp. AN32]|uniref:Yip1 family protein n=1 Tax=Christiangramia antarctica TaxID=2058158 RepID=A0ABW5XA76_9FLAO|nr:Yip1 family protein [Gramella sp. AN32]